MRICAHKITKKIIEMQSDGVSNADLDILIRNGIAAGYNEDEIHAFFENSPQPSVYHDMHDGTVWVENTEKKDTGTIDRQRKTEILREQENTGLKDVTVQQAKDVITARYDTVRVLPVAGANNAETIANIEAKIDALINACQWVDIKEAIYLLR